MVGDKELRKFIFDNTEYVRTLLLTDAQKLTLKWIEKKGLVTTAEYAARKDCSVQSACGGLKSLFNNGWLVRKQEQDPTGGIIYTYKRK